MGGDVHHFPVKLNPAGVMPVIFASSIMQFPVVIAALMGKGNGTGIGSEILKGMNQSNWCNPEQIHYTRELLV